MSKVLANLLFSFFAISCLASAEAPLTDQPLRYAVPFDHGGNGVYVAKLELGTAEEVENVLKRAETFLENIEQYPDFEPITVILHGPELKAFDRRNYREFKEVVGLAARLEAFNIIDVQVCEEQMRQDGISLDDLPAFAETVPYGPAEEQRLIKRGYQYF